MSGGSFAHLGSMPTGGPAAMKFARPSTTIFIDHAPVLIEARLKVQHIYLTIEIFLVGDSAQIH